MPRATSYCPGNQRWQTLAMDDPAYPPAYRRHAVAVLVRRMLDGLASQVPA